MNKPSTLETLVIFSATFLLGALITPMVVELAPIHYVIIGLGYGMIVGALMTIAVIIKLFVHERVMTNNKGGE